MLDQKKLFYFLHAGILKVCDNSALIMFGHLIAYNLYKIHLKEPINFVIILYQAITIGISKSAANLSV